MRFRPDIWLLGLPLVAATAAIGVWQVATFIEGDLRREIQAEEARSAGTELGRLGARVEVDGRELTVTTDAPLSPAGQAEAQRLAASVPGLRGPAYRVLVPATVERFAFSVKHGAPGLVLGGYVPPGGLRAELIEDAGEDGRSVRDDLRSALGAPERFDEAARLALRVARNLQGATASVEDRILSVSGDAPDTKAYREVTALLRSLPAGYSAGRVEIRPPLIRPFTWSATREGGGLVLGGHVPSEAERQALLSAAAKAASGLKVEDRMDVARGLESGVAFQDVTKRALEVLAQVESGRAELKGRGLALEGKLAARDLLPKMRDELKIARLPGVEIERLDLAHVVPRPYRFSAIRRDGRLRLSGFMPAEADLAALREAVQQRFQFDQIVDDLHLADGAPEGMLSAARYGVDRLALLSQGEVIIEDRKLRLSGEGLYAEQARRTQSEFARAAPAGWTASAEVTAVPYRPLDPGFCGDLVSDVVRRDPVAFEPGRAELTAEAKAALGGLANVMRRCGSATLLVTSVIEAPGEADPLRDLAERRAAAIVSALGESGIAASAKASAVKLADGAKASERIEFEVQP